MTLSVAVDEQLVGLIELSVEELCSLAEVTLGAGQQKRLSALLGQNSLGSLSSDEQEALDELLAEADQVALQKARVWYTLKLRGIPLNNISTPRYG